MKIKSIVFVLTIVLFVHCFSSFTYAETPLSKTAGDVYLAEKYKKIQNDYSRAALKNTVIQLVYVPSGLLGVATFILLTAPSQVTHPASKIAVGAFTLPLGIGLSFYGIPGGFLAHKLASITNVYSLEANNLRDQRDHFWERYKTPFDWAVHHETLNPASLREVLEISDRPLSPESKALAHESYNKKKYPKEMFTHLLFERERMLEYCLMTGVDLIQNQPKLPMDLIHEIRSYVSNETELEAESRRARNTPHMDPAPESI